MHPRIWEFFRFDVHATFSAPGAYELELTASDGELSGTTRVLVTVK
jgi:hypothetical protein